MKIKMSHLTVLSTQIPPNNSLIVMMLLIILTVSYNILKKKEKSKWLISGWKSNCLSVIKNSDIAPAADADTTELHSTTATYTDNDQVIPAWILVNYVKEKLKFLILMIQLAVLMFKQTQLKLSINSHCVSYHHLMSHFETNVRNHWTQVHCGL